MKFSKCILLTALAAACFADVAAARQAPQNQDPLQALRAKDSFNDADRTALTAWVAEQFAIIRGDDRAAAGRAVHRLAAANTGGSAFRREMADACIQTVGKSYKNVEVVPASMMLSALNLINDAEAYAVFVEALADDRLAVRYSAAAGLRNLRAKLSIAGAKYVTESLTSLREAGLKESSAPTLKTIYNAMNFHELPNPPETKANVEALLTLLDNRAKQYTAGRVRAFGADSVGLRVTGAFSASDMTQEQRKRFTIIVGKMFRYAVRIYTTATKTDEGVVLSPSTSRQDTELLIREAEKQLLSLLSPPPSKRPDIVQWMQKVDQLHMKMEFNKWGDLVKQATDYEIFQDSPTTSQPAGGAP